MFLNIVKNGEKTTKFQFTWTGAKPHRNRKLLQFNNAQYCINHTQNANNNQTLWCEHFFKWSRRNDFNEWVTYQGLVSEWWSYCLPYLITYTTKMIMMGSAGLQIKCINFTSINIAGVISSPKPMFDNLLESSRWDDTNKWSNIGFGEDLDIIEINLRILSGALDQVHMNKKYYPLHPVWMICIHEYLHNLSFQKCIDCIPRTWYM